MSLKLILFGLAAMATASTALAVDPWTTGGLNTPANHIVGLWRTQAAVGPCGSGQTPIQIRNTLQFHAGGTLVESVPPGIPRVEGLGTWKYNPDTRQWRLHLLFDWWLPDGSYDGYSTVDRKLLMSNDGKRIAGPVRSVRYAANGSVIAELCGHAVSTRQ
ncbi:hypothetical protein LF41_1135 [Lysobacter dokdonensis DS-58]|uniref:DUF1579 domain-containing protein n=1 Tax=Lysobacter dokdonensis DS-58 TaxID=1300345 RepID=A0A0A2WLD2_9GAMM|nr:hypothetical protein [Lysobacter dokdonensis]KGQ20598.1 hypothetical protein LF41_1135 [Lysobacter dokdonensis DS-58]